MLAACPARRMPRPRPGPNSRDVLRVEKRESPGGVAWEFVHPRCARKRREVGGVQLQAGGSRGSRRLGVAGGGRHLHRHAGAERV